MDELLQAVLIASDPSQVALHHQALAYLSNVQENASTTWRLALNVFVESTDDGARKHPPQARFFALRVLDEFFDNRFDPLDEESFTTLKQAILTYTQSEFVYGPAESNATFLRNKFSHTLTLFFLCTYIEQWSTFFADLFALIRPIESHQHSSFNQHISLLFFHLILEISGEVADQMIKSARTYSTARHARDASVRDAMRERDAPQINEAVLTIVANGVERMLNLRKNEGLADSSRELDEVTEVVDWGLRTFGSYVGWIDINLTVTPTTIPLLFNSLSDPSLPIRLAASVALLRIVAKGLKEPADKLQLIKVLSLGQVIDALELKTRAQQAERGESTDEGEESYREALGKLLNVLGLELIKLVDDCPDAEVSSEASRLLSEILPVMLRFMADEYDDTSNTVFPLLQTILSSYKRMRKMSTAPVDDSKRSFLASLLQVILNKLKWDEEDDPEDMDDDDKASFEDLRKELRTFIDAVLMIDQELVTDAVRVLALNTLTAFREGHSLKWHDAELAIYLVFMYGEVNKTGGKGRAAFCQAPAVPKENRKTTDYSEYPLTTHGEMLLTLVQSGISSYPNRTVAMQFFETVTRYGDFFKVRRECIMPTLHAMIDLRGLHNQNAGVRSRLFYLFYRFIKDIRNDIPLEIVRDLVEGMRDLLVIQVEIPELEDASQQDLLTEAANNPGIFDSQLYLYETVGILISLLLRTPEEQEVLLLSIVKPLLDELADNLQRTIKGGKDITPILKVHHIIMTLGNVAKGYPDYPSPVPEGYVFPPLDVFGQIAQAILVCLEATNIYKIVREATRFAFARIIATTGPTITQFIPPLMANLLTHFEPSELVDFMNFISLLIHKLQKDMLDVLDQLIGPLSDHITAGLSQPISGTDDQLSHADTQKAYLALLNNIMAAKLHDVFTSERNKGNFESLLAFMQRLLEDITDPISQKAALNFFSRCVVVWGNANDDAALPGFEHFMYGRLLSSAFAVLSLPSLNIKDGQVLMVLNEIANFLHTMCRVRGSESYDYLLTVFLPSQNWPPDTAMEFTTKIRDLDSKAFRKYFTDFVRSSRS